MLIAFNKPCGVLSRFTPDGSPNRSLAEFGFPKDVYPLGRLDADSEGLLLLSDEPRLNQALLHPRESHQREYWAQVERIPPASRTAQARRGARPSSTPDAALPRLDSRSAAGDCPARSADPLPQDRADLLDWPGIDRGQEPPGAPHDRGHWASHLAAYPGEDRALRTTWPVPRQVENPDRIRARAAAGPLTRTFTA